MTPKLPAKKARNAPAKKAPTAKLRPDETDTLYLPDGTDGPDGFASLIPAAFLLKYDTFVSEYLTSGDAPAAAKIAGFVGKNDQSQKAIGGALLRNVYVATLIHERARSLMAKHRITAERVWEEIAHTAFLDPGEAYNEDGSPKKVPDMPEHVRRAIVGYKEVEKTFGEDGHSLEREIKFNGKDAAIDKLMKLLRMVDQDKLVIVDGQDFLNAMEEGRERARAGGR